MKKVGIVTHYYQNNNYGGNLQAYALATYINNLDNYTAEQICFSFLDDLEDHKVVIKRKLCFKNPKSFLKKCLIFFKQIFHLKTYKKIIYNYLNKKYSKHFKIRKEAILDFNQNIIPHSKKIYNESLIKNCGDLYDIFITGSDQVWSGPSNAFMLGFVENKIKISYAASIARKETFEEHKRFLKEKIKDYTAISVRDKTDKAIVDGLTDKQVEIVLDPVFLLDKLDWDHISQKSRTFKEKYIFCYFLGDSKKYKKIAQKFAKKKKLKIVNIPHFKDNENKIVINDLFFGNYKPFNVSPADFVALIRDAEFIITDSFHALAFSIIYNKQFFIFDRKSKWGQMSSRIINLLNMFDLACRFCQGEQKETYEYLNSLAEIDYTYCNNILSERKTQSEDFLINNLYGFTNT